MNDLPIDPWPPLQQLERIIAQSQEPGSRRLVVAAANIGYVDFADNFAQSLLRQNVSNFVLVPLDGQAERALIEAYPQHSLPLMPGLQADPLENYTSLLTKLWIWVWSRIRGSGAYASTFNTPGFKALTESRPALLSAIVAHNFSVLYNDVDMVWQHNLWHVLDREWVPNTSSGAAHNTVLWKDGATNLCSCLVYFPASDNASKSESIALLSQWQREVETGAYANDQPALNAAFQRKKLTSQISTTIVVENSDAFPTGAMYFYSNPLAAQNNSSAVEERRRKAVVIHNNYIKGRAKKLARFRDFGLWKPSGKLNQRL